MNFKQRALHLAATGIITLSLLAPANVFAEESINTKADILNKLTLLQGDGSGYNLDGQLKRSEAAAFIVRIMGKEDHVLQNKDKYRYTSFSDVENGMWYAPYIGYCVEQQIISGFDDSTYKPNDNVSEKAFLKILLGAMEYIEGADFTWDNVYKKAYEVGLVTESWYQSTGTDNAQFKREGVVKAIYNSLKKEKKKSKISVIDNMVKAGVIERITAVSAGLLKDEPVTAIGSAEVQDSGTVVVKLNEDVKPIAKEKIAIYEKDNYNAALSINEALVSGGEVTIKTSNQTHDKQYSIELRNIEDFEGNVVELVASTFTGYKPAEVKSDFFRISKVESVSKDVINVYFTQPITLNSAMPGNLEILRDGESLIKGTFQNMNVKLLNGYDNALAINIKESTFEAGVKYTLKVSGDLSSAYGIEVNEGSGESWFFVGSKAENEALKVEDLTPLDIRTVELVFNKEIDTKSALKKSNYTLKTSKGSSRSISEVVMAGEGVDKGKIVHIRLSTNMDEDTGYELNVDGVTDLLGTSDIDDEDFEFQGTEEESVDVTVTEVEALDEGTIAVYFDRPLDPSKARDESNYRIVGVTESFNAVPEKVYYDPSIDPFMIKLYLDDNDKLDGDEEYELKVYDEIEDYLGRANEDIFEYEFDGNGDENLTPIIEDARIIAENVVIVTVSEEISSTSPNTSATNYILEYKDDGDTETLKPKSVSIYKNKFIILKFSKDLDFDVKYKLKVNILEDYAGIGSTDDDSETVKLGEQ